MIRLYFFGGIVLIILLVGAMLGYLVGDSHGKRAASTTHDQIIAGLQGKISELERQAKTEKIRADSAETDYLAAYAALDASDILARRYRSGLLLCRRNSQANPVSPTGKPAGAADAGATGAGMGEPSTGPDIAADDIYAITRRCDDLTEQLRALQQWAR